MHISVENQLKITLVNVIKLPVIKVKITKCSAILYTTDNHPIFVVMQTPPSKFAYHLHIIQRDEAILMIFETFTAYIPCLFGIRQGIVSAFVDAC